MHIKVYNSMHACVLSVTIYFLMCCVVTLIDQLTMIQLEKTGRVFSSHYGWYISTTICDSIHYTFIVAVRANVGLLYDGPPLCPYVLRVLHHASRLVDDATAKRKPATILSKCVYQPLYMLSPYCCLVDCSLKLLNTLWLVFQSTV